MFCTIPTREYTIQVVNDLIDGKREAVEVGLWAAEVDKPEHKHLDEKLSRSDPELREFLNVINLAAQQGSGGSLLYGKDDFKEWLQEFENKINS